MSLHGTERSQRKRFYGLFNVEPHPLKAFCLGLRAGRQKRALNFTVFRYTVQHKVHMYRYLEYYSVCLLVRIGTPHPLYRK
jgi:hypothetical protein